MQALKNCVCMIEVCVCGGWGRRGGFHSPPPKKNKKTKKQLSIPPQKNCPSPPPPPQKKNCPFPPKFQVPPNFTYCLHNELHFSIVVRVKNNFSGQLAKWPTTLKFGWPYGNFGWPSCSRAHVAQIHFNA